MTVVRKGMDYLLLKLHALVHFPRKAINQKSMFVAFHHGRIYVNFIQKMTRGGRYVHGNDLTLFDVIVDELSIG
jgi:hypothetical protein